ncbi:bifunctional proline dehydrogenase/L-glutamate gamma-semialdehyde dehydrogenase PutA [Chitiniphilus eburneus]|uniref:Bifunctional protein PutA n=1 Tax=Chitiniphilus eburneus TaxID=2571148 RepID=A0A4U0PLT2_9NEIS|nr:bifunctional proline dehydrogenase/L-glutamate gamma-semialdehyde dehydrogenase PutA [Chitiniphilus eburneus]TJZ69037.1 bifunctional proline dehydrogenase/L-glutamate gamma-semialdehyde dehydrogenase PutA [Chitiniphilus eburneus]
MMSAEFALPDADREPVLDAVRHADEVQVLRELLPLARLSGEENNFVQGRGELILDALRNSRRHGGGADALFAAFPLASPAGRALLTLAEALIRIPDIQTMDRLIRDQLHAADWQQGERSPSLLVNLARRGLIAAESWSESRPGEALVRFALRRAMRHMGEHFVIGEDIATALAQRVPGFSHSFDMLGEAALTEEDAERYSEGYAKALMVLAEQGGAIGARSPCGISVKLSALHPRFERRQRERVMRELYPRLLALATMAREAELPFTIDAEESERVPLTLALFKRLLAEPGLEGWDGLGLAVQAYLKQAPRQIDWLIAQAAAHRRHITVRLVKGAYWDSEIKRAQLEGWPDYAVFTRKYHADASFLACARKMLRADDTLYPAFATHNVFSALAVHAMAGGREFEFQCLFGMGEEMYRLLRGHGIDRPCRLYAPVGRHAALLPYLVRRLMENGANQSFVHLLLASGDSDTATLDPVAASVQQPARGIALPIARHAHPPVTPGIDWSDETALAALARALATQPAPQHAMPMLASGTPEPGPVLFIANPASPSQAVGTMQTASPADIAAACQTATSFAPLWSALPTAERASVLECAADLIAAQRDALLPLLCREAGKTLPAALGEIREAADFCRYYAREARRQWPERMPSALGPVAAISPWNFPLAIFVGQIAAALVVGNPVLAKPAEETPLTAALAVRLLWQAGVPHAALQLLPGGPEVGEALTRHPAIRGVLFTGSLPAAQAIHRTLAAGDARRPLIAETGGMNAMLVDSSALPEQVVQDVLDSAFDSAGQRCSALRVLCLPAATAERITHLLRAAMRELQVGDPCRLDTDVGPLISADALSRVSAALRGFIEQGQPVHQAPLQVEQGHFMAPALVEISHLARLPGEIFGPVLAVLRYRHEELPGLLAELNARQYGLTLAVASRCPSFVEQVAAAVRVGNVYVNRNQIGAVVGHQPFGGERLSGTGPKAGGPWLLWRLLRNADPCGEPANPTAAHPAQPTLLRLARERGQDAPLHPAITSLFQRSPLAQRRELPAVVGERNVLAYRGRGVVGCVARTIRETLLQTATALATGNRVCLPDTADNVAIQAALPEYVVLSANLDEAPLDALLWDGIAEPDLPRRLAARAGPIIQPVLPDAEGDYPLFRLLTECVTAINTAAAGGDAELMGKGVTAPPEPPHGDRAV